MKPVVDAAPASEPFPGSERPKHPILPPHGPPDAQFRTHFSFWSLLPQLYIGAM